MKLCETKTISFEQYTDIDFIDVSSFYIRNAFGDRVYFSTRSREIAQHTCDDMYGKGVYKVNSTKTGGSRPEKESAVGRLNMKSRMNSRGVR